MVVELLADDERNILLRCMQIVLQEQYIDQFEFQTRLGVDREELQTIISNWPINDTDHESIAQLAINNCLNEVAYGIPIDDHQLEKHIGVSRSELVRIYQKWRALSGETTTGIG